MKPERIVQIHVAGLTTIGAVLLGMGQGSALLPLLVVFAAITSLVFTDTLNWFRLNRVVANLAALVALFVSLGDFAQPNTRTQLLAIANLLVYLQITSFYQRKSSRIYWHLIVFSLLQVVVSAALNVEFEFGVVLIVYIVVGISTLAFFFAHREVSQVMPERRDLRRQDKGGGTGQTGAEEESRWKRLASHEMVATPVASRLRLRRQAISWGFLGEIAVICLTTMVFSFVLFFSAPRMEGSATTVRWSRMTKVVGFSREVTLNELTNVLQNDEPVMRLSIMDYQTGNHYLVFGDPYIRGSVLTEYVIERGIPKWKQGVDSSDESRGTLGGRIRTALRGRERKWRLPALPADGKFVRQNIILRPMNEPVLFAVFPAFVDPFVDQETRRDVRYNPYTGQLFSQSRRHSGRQQEYRYSLATTAFRGGLQMDVTPHEYRLKSLDDPFDLAAELRHLRRFDERRFPRLKQIADEIAEKQKANDATQAMLARALCNHFQDPERYNYSLNFRRIPRDASLDPIEDFVVNHRTGHCEYFASALAMMLRSQGIPSRLVVGFKPSEYNDVGNYYQVLQRDAHAWVEAYLPAEEIPGLVPPGTYISPGGGWLRLEPTLGAAEDAASIEEGFMDAVDDVLDHARTLWTDYILGLTAKRQRESIYGAVSDGANSAAWEASLGQLRKERDAILRWLRSQAAILTVSAVALLAAFCLARKRRVTRANATPVVQAVRRWTARLTGQSESDRLCANAMRVVEFYRRFESLLAGAGITRRSSQTQRELAKQASERLAICSSSGTFDGLIDRIVGAFYRVRFGQIPLDEQETRAIEHALATLERDVITSQRTPTDRDESSEE